MQLYKKRNYKDCLKRFKKSFFWREDGKVSGILQARCKKVGWNFFWFAVITITVIFLFCFRNEFDLVKYVDNLPWFGWVMIFIVSTLLIVVLEKEYFSVSYLISSLHMFLPRLVASITLSWITLSMGFDLYVSYFDNPPRLLYIVCIVVIVMLFVMFEINRITPHASPFRKFWRSFELMIISYFISLSVGFLIINFLGEKYLERGGYISDYYTQHVEERDGNLFRKENKKIEEESQIDTCSLSYDGMKLNIIRKVEDDSNPSHLEQVENLKQVRFNDTDSYYIAAEESFWGIHIFILRDFLIMFAFIAMFVGIFIQLIIFGDNKQMTEL